VLGAVGGASGLLLGAGGGAALLRWVFQQGWVVPWSMLLGVWAGITLLTVIAGWEHQRSRAPRAAPGGAAGDPLRWTVVPPLIHGYVARRVHSFM
jgi:hypothetical protein